MAKKGIKFSKQHLANLRAAHARRRKKPNKIVSGLIQAITDYKPNEWKAVEPPNGLISRMTQAIDKIQSQIERLETL